MAKYRKIDPKIWNDQKFRACTEDAKLTFVFILTHPNLTALGAMRATTPGLAAELGWSVKRLSTAISQLTHHAMVEVDEQACFIGLPKFLRYNEPEGPNSVVKAWPAAIQMIPECPAKSALIVRCTAYLDSRSDAFRDAIPDAIKDAIRDGIKEPSAMPTRILEQELEQEPKLELEQEPKPSLFDEAFEVLWKKYPDRDGKKTGKEEARRKFKALSAGDRLLVQQAVEYYADHIGKTRGKAKDLHRFLRDGKGIQPWREWLEPATAQPNNGKGLFHGTSLNDKQFVGF